MTWKIDAGSCVTTKSNVKHVSGAKFTSIVHQTTNACGGLVYSKSLHPSFAWTPKSVHPTVATFSGFRFLENKAGEEGFTMPNTGGTARVVGSFAGKNRGASSDVTLYTSLTIAKFRAACDSSAGLSGYTIISGTATFS